MRNINKSIFVVFVLISLCVSRGVLAQVGASCSTPYIIYPATTCANTCGAQLCGNMQCPTGNCDAFVNAAGSSGGLNPACSVDDERTQNVVWLEVYATAADFTINNGKPYVGGSAAAASARDYAVYSGACGSLIQLACGTVAASSSVTITGLTAGQRYKVMISPPNNYTTAVATSVCITSSVGYTAPGNTCSTAVSVSTNVTYTMTNAGSPPSGPICSGSVENDTWYRWCAPSNWPSGQLAYISIYDQVCNTAQGLQLSVWNTNALCPTASTSTNVVCQNPGVTTPYYYQWLATANQCYYVAVDGYAGTACQFRLTIGSTIVLPVELVYFDAKLKNQRVELTWMTATEKNNDHFTVERSKDGREFEPLAVIGGSGTTSTEHVYSTIDVAPFAGTSYYRLKQTDFDGQFTYSSPVAIKNNFGKDLIRLYPNPSEGKFNIDLDGSWDKKLTVVVNNLSGTEVLHREIGDYTSDTSLFLDASGLPFGIYFLTVKGETVCATQQLVLR